jgi:hypothetical protein
LLEDADPKPDLSVTIPDCDDPLYSDSDPQPDLSETIDDCEDDIMLYL